MFHVNSDQVFNLLRLLKGSLHLSQEYALNSSQLLLNLILLLASLKRIQHLQVLEENITDELENLTTTIILRCVCSFALDTATHLVGEIFDDREFTRRALLQLEIARVKFRHNLIQFLLDVVLNLLFFFHQAQTLIFCK